MTLDRPSPLLVALLSLILGLGAFTGVNPARPGGLDVRSDARRRVEKLAGDVAKVGLEEAAQACVEQVAALGADEKALTRLTERIEKALAKARGVPKERALERLTQAAETCAEALAGAAAEAEDGERATLYGVALALDSSSEHAHRALGHVQAVDGSWCSPEVAKLVARRLEMATWLQRARQLEVEVEAQPAEDPTLLELYGERASAVGFQGLRIESPIDPERLAELLRGTLRTMAFGNWLQRGELVPSLKPGLFLHLPDEVSYERYVAAAYRAGRLTDEQRQQSSQMGGFWIEPAPGQSRGGDALVHRATAGELNGILIYYYDTSLRREGFDGEFGDTITPHWLKSGHCNFISLSVLGGAIPSVVLRTEPEGTRSTGAKVQIKLARAGLVGCRSWLEHLARGGRAPSLARSVVDQAGKISADNLLRVTSSVEYLHQRAEMAEIAKRCAQVWQSQPRNKGSLLERSESILGRSVPEFDAEWERWLLDGPAGRSVRDMISSVAPSGGGAGQDALARLNGIRQEADLDPVELEPELSAGAALHAAYLELHPDQKIAWPDAHEEYPESEGFTPTGAWAGAHSVIAFNGARTAIDEWMGTFYHRVPLTHPGLLRIGVGVAGETTVLDCTSLSDPTGGYEGHYPFDGQRDVPLRFVPELPNPIPEREDQRSLGYPITYQLGPWYEDTAVELSLFLGDEPVECFYSTPTSPTNPALAPDGCYCLIPAAPLVANSEYRVEVRGPATTESFRFRTGRR